jgi:hypothetical protein
MGDSPTRDPRKAVGLAMTAAVAVIASFVAGKAARDAILLSNFPITMLPLFVGIAAATSIPLVLISGRLMIRFGPGRLMTALNAASAVMLIVEYLVFRHEPRVAAVATFFHLSTLGAVLVSGFWSIINEQFDAQTAKRHIGRVGLAATLGGIAGGLVAERSAVYLEPGAILLVLAGLQAACAVVLYRLSRGDPHAAPNDDAGDEELRGWSALKHVARSSLLRNLALVIVLDAIAAAVLDYLFKAEVTAAAGAAGPLRFFGIFYTVTNTITALVQLVGARPVVERLGVARSVASLPVTVTLVGVAAFAAPGLTSTVIARGGEMVTRSSIFRAAYELLYAPLLDQRKRSTKVILDVGAERIGDLLGAQLVAAVLYLAPVPHDWLVISAIFAGILAFGFALRLPRAYTAEVEHSMRTWADAEPRRAYRGVPILTEAGDLTAIALVNMRAFESPPRRPSVAVPVSSALVPPATAAPVGAPADLGGLVSDLCATDPDRIRRALAMPIPVELAALVVPLVGRPDVAGAAIAVLRKIATRSTGVLIDALLDPACQLGVRRRIPSILESAEPERARWALWKGLADPLFEIRYLCGRALSRLAPTEQTAGRTADDVFAAVLREIQVDAEVWRSHKPTDDDDDDLGDDDDDAAVLRELMRRSSHGLEHVFTLLGLALPAEPLRIALQALHTDDGALRSTALEYLESVLPGEIKSVLWPLIESATHATVPPGESRVARPRPPEEILTGLQLSKQQIVENLRRVAARDAMRSKRPGGIARPPGK